MKQVCFNMRMTLHGSFYKYDHDFGHFNECSSYQLASGLNHSIYIALRGFVAFFLLKLLFYLQCFLTGH